MIAMQAVPQNPEDLAAVGALVLVVVAIAGLAFILPSIWQEKRAAEKSWERANAEWDLADQAREALIEQQQATTRLYSEMSWAFQYMATPVVNRYLARPEYMSPVVLDDLIPRLTNKAGRLIDLAKEHEENETMGKRARSNIDTELAAAHEAFVEAKDTPNEGTARAKIAALEAERNANPADDKPEGA